MRFRRTQFDRLQSCDLARPLVRRLVADLARDRRDEELTFTLRPRLQVEPCYRVRFLPLYVVSPLLTLSLLLFLFLARRAQAFDRFVPFLSPHLTSLPADLSLPLPVLTVSAKRRTSRSTRSPSTTRSRTVSSPFSRRRPRLPKRRWKAAI